MVHHWRQREGRVDVACYRDHTHPRVSDIMADGVVSRVFNVFDPLFVVIRELAKLICSHNDICVYLPLLSLFSHLIHVHSI